MVVRQLLTQDSQTHGESALGQLLTQENRLSGLERLLRSTGLQCQLEALLLDCSARSYSPRTIEGYRKVLTVFVKFCNALDIHDPKDVTPNHIRLYLVQQQTHMATISVHHHYRAVKRFFNWMVEEDILKEIPFKNVHMKVPQIIIQPYPMETIERMVAACDDTKFIGSRDKALILMLLDTGLRLKEITSVMISDINPQSGLITVLGKGNKKRVVRVGKRAQKALFKYLMKRNDEYPNLWVSEERRPLTSWGVYRSIHSLSHALGITDVKRLVHAFRHTFATQSLRNGAGEFEVQSLLGHTTLKMTHHYVETLNSQDAVISHRKFSPADNMRGK